MITIVTGKINSGKTTTMLEHYRSHQQGDGFVSIKHMHHDQIDHYSIHKLSTGEEKVWLIHEKSIILGYPSSVTIGPYRVILSTVDWVEHEIRAMMIKHVSPLYLDEIGLLELNHQGFHHILCEMMDSMLDVVLTIRDRWLDDVIKHYHMTDITLIHCP